MAGSLRSLSASSSKAKCNHNARLVSLEIDRDAGECCFTTPSHSSERTCGKSSERRVNAKNGLSCGIYRVRRVKLNTPVGADLTGVARLEPLSKQFRCPFAKCTWENRYIYCVASFTSCNHSERATSLKCFMFSSHKDFLICSTKPQRSP